MKVPYWLHRALSWPIRFVAQLTGHYEPCLDCDFVRGTYTDDKIWPFHRDVMEILSLTGTARITPQGLWVEGENGTAHVTMLRDRKLSNDELKKLTE